jgi:hypothetical protein
MSNWKHAYGWSGHILINENDHSSNLNQNLIAILSDVFEKILNDYRNCKLDERIGVEQLGIIDSDYYFLAAGSPVTFSEGYEYYGTIFSEAELRCEPGPNVVDHDSIYLKAMKEIYGLELPPCHLMIGCSSEH